MSNGKGSKSRPLSVDHDTFSNNWDRVFGKKSDECAYSGLPSMSNYMEPPVEYTNLLKSGVFWELFPGLTGMWSEDKTRWNSVVSL